MKCLKTAMSNILAVNSTGQALSRTAPHLISKTQLLQNDRDWDSDVSQLSITAVLEAKGGTVTLTQSGDILFTPDASYTGVMGFKYTVQDAQGNYTQVTSPTGQTVAMKAAVYLQTSDIPNDPLAVEQWYLADTNYYQKRSCSHMYLLGYSTKRVSKQARNEQKSALDKQNKCYKIKKLINSRRKYASSPIDAGAIGYEINSARNKKSASTTQL